MKIENIEVADITLKDTIRKESEIQFVFPKIYIINQKKYIENCSLIIKNWSVFLAKLFICDVPFSVPKEHILTDENLESFDLIQEISIQENKLILGGYSAVSKYWMVYEFIDYEYEIISR